MTRDALILAVALHMDEITPESSLDIHVDGADNNPLYALIDGLLDDCALEIFYAAPYWRLPQTLFSNESTVVSPLGDRYIIRLKLPDDFLRVAEINCADFKRPITEVVAEQSAEGKRQHYKYLMGREAKPVGVLSYGTWGNNNDKCREIDCYSVSSNISPAVVVASYIARPTIASTGDITFPETLIPALEWLAAARTFAARGDSNREDICQQKAQNLLI